MNIGKKAILLTATAGALVFGGAGAAVAQGGDNWAFQVNSCDTAAGPIANTGAAAPTGDINVGSECINFTNSSGAVFQSNDCDTSTGAIATVGGAAPTGDVTVGSKCANIAVDESNGTSNGSSSGSSKAKGSRGYGR